jgi:hypothetical protein
MKIIGQRILISPGTVAHVAARGCSYTGTQIQVHFTPTYHPTNIFFPNILYVTIKLLCTLQI